MFGHGNRLFCARAGQDTALLPVNYRYLHYFIVQQFQSFYYLCIIQPHKTNDSFGHEEVLYSHSGIGLYFGVRENARRNTRIISFSQSAHSRNDYRRDSTING